MTNELSDAIPEAILGVPPPDPVPSVHPQRIARDHAARQTQQLVAFGHLANEDPVLATRHSQADPFKCDVYDRTGEDRFRVLAFLTVGQVVTQRVAAEQYDNLRRIADEPLGADSVIRLATDGLTDAGIAKFKITAPPCVGERHHRRPYRPG